MRPAAARALLCVACGPGSADPAFVATDLDAIPCADPSVAGSCVEVRAPVDGSRPGEGTCRILDGSRPEADRRVVASGPLEMVPGTSVVWVVELPEGIDPEHLSAVCSPMSEG